MKDEVFELLNDLNQKILICATKTGAKLVDMDFRTWLSLSMLFFFLHHQQKFVVLSVSAKMLKNSEELISPQFFTWNQIFNGVKHSFDEQNGLPAPMEMETLLPAPTLTDVGGVFLYICSVKHCFSRCNFHQKHWKTSQDDHHKTSFWGMTMMQNQKMMDELQPK